MLAVSAGWLAACLRVRSPASYLLAAYVVAWAEVVVLCVALSLPEMLTRGTLLGGLAVLALASWALRRRLGKPQIPLRRAHARWLLEQLRDPALGLLAAGVAIGYAYVAALAFLTPQNDGDPLVYQLTRAALWRQDRGIGIAGADFEVRLDVNPIVAEVGQLATMVTAGSARYVALGQLAGVAALALATYCLSRRIGLRPRGALFGALVVPTLPVIALQSWTAGNDVVVASFVVAAAAFVLGERRNELILAGLATALAVGTKFTGPLMLPALLLLALLGARAGRARAVAALLAGAVLGSGWYVVNLVRTGDLDGGLGEASGQTASFGLDSVARTGSQLLLASVDASGSIEGYALAYAVAAGIFAAALIAVRAAPIAFVGPVLVALAPLAAGALGRLLADALGWGWDLAGNAATAEELRDWELPTAANAYMSWYGPVALLLAVVVMVAAVRARRRGSVSRAAVALALAPIVSLAVVSVALDYELSRGRFFIAPVAVACAVLGLLTRVRWIAGAIAVTCVVTLGLVLVNAMPKPSGIQAGLYAASPSIWELERWQAQMILRPFPSDGGETDVVAYVEQHVPETATVALQLRGNDFMFPYFGPELRRTIQLLDAGEWPSSDAEWLVAAPDRTTQGCDGSWRVAYTSGNWRVLQRIAPDRCEGVVSVETA